jgi:Xaa-Pro aminopeptidase
MLPSTISPVFRSRRDCLMAGHSGAAFILASNLELIRNYDVTYPFRQDSSLYYLTGWDEPDSFMVLIPSADHPGRNYKMVLFVPPRDPEREMWDGERHGVEGAVAVFGADEAYPTAEFAKRMPVLLKGVEKVFYRIGMPHHERTDRMVLDTFEQTRKLFGRSGRGLPDLQDPLQVIGEMRLYKGPEEVEILRRACTITANAHKQAMIDTRPGMNERDIEAIVEYHFRRGGSQRNGYWSIVAAGRNATCLHYRSNNDTLRDGDLLLIDAGAEFDYYTSDITRTFPVGRKYSEAQAKVYDLVLKAQLGAIAMAKPGATLPSIHAHVVETLVDGFLSLGLLQGSPAEIIQTNAFKRFYPHNTSHWLGSDVHDAGLYQKNGEPRRLEPGMVFTIEPGFYVQPLDREAPAAYRDIGIRIEDDILVTKTGCENMTAGVPKARDEIEALRQF